MKTKVLTSAVLVVLFAVSFAWAEDQKGFWSSLKSKIQGLTPSREASVTTAVGGVRGAKDDKAGTMYWKGEDVVIVVSKEEVEAFDAALNLAIAGDSETALKAFEEFVKDFPQSPLEGDADKAVEELKASSK